MKHWTVIIVSLLISHQVYAQSVADSPDRDQLQVGQTYEVDNEKSNAAVKKFDVDLTLGTSFTYSPNNFYGPSVFVAPSLNYAINPKFSISAGVAVERANFYPLYTSTEEEQNMLPMTRVFMYTRGTYQLSPRLSVGGTAYKVINDVPRLTSYSSPHGYNFEGMSFDLNYKITNSISVGFQMRLQNGSYYYDQNSLIPREGYVPLNGF